ncbi:hypothetical protein Poli38472_006167 [Pythium oligandrum]|uniref:DNA polymerase kappa n=1 Tax=Pythium oligandrum TaxID=41045 RepID=A0A8K1FPT7_PYTOL|nr:hypothetical protein Poli38472_006167 [Pythium oligandrum]|eukprot:TMW68699.1 hypothetical protein Poli38472_006167 [Pythium oligandrum]
MHDAPSAAPETASASADETKEDAHASSAATEAAQMFVFTAQKAGMKDVDKEHVQKVVYEMSKDSLFFQNSIKQNQKVEARINEMKLKLRGLTKAKHETLRRQIDPLVAQWETQRDLTRTMVVVDMDMFYAAVEMRDNPSLRGKPVAVGGIGMLSTTNYEARKFGVRAAMPGFIGKELCPELIIVPTNFKKYTTISQQVRAIVADYDPNFTAMSLDEVYLDITDYMEANWAKYAGAGGGRSESDDEADQDGEEIEDQSHAMNSQRETVAAAIVDEIRRRIHGVTQLTASAGIAANTMLAKICSDINKPNGQYVLPFTRDRVVSFVQGLPVRKIGGIGKVMEKVLGALGITTAKDIYDHRVELFHALTPRSAAWLLQISMGVKQSSGEPSERKSYSRERTFRGIGDPRWLEKICREVCDMLGKDLAEGGHGAKTLTLKLKCVDFSVRTRAVSSTCIMKTSDDLFAYAIELLRKEMPLELRLLGVRASALVSLDEDEAKSSGGQRKRQTAMDKFTSSVAEREAIDPFEVLNLQLLAQSDGNASSADDGDVNAQGGRKRQLAIKAFAVDSRQIEALPADVSVASSVQRSPQKRQRVLAMSVQTESKSEETPTVDAVEESFQPCPICGKTINAGNAIAIDMHVEKCLRGEATEPSFGPRKSRQRSRGNSSQQSTIHQFLNSPSKFHQVS